MRKVFESSIELPVGLARGVVGIDAGLTLTKVVRSSNGGLTAFAFETGAVRGDDLVDEYHTIGVTGARGSSTVASANVTVSQEIEAAATGVRALLAANVGDFVLALLGTGTAFAAVRGDGATHLGGTPLGGGSFAGIARRFGPMLTYEAMISKASRGDRRRADLMVSDAYPEGIGRIGGDMTAAHLAKHGDPTLDDVLAALLNLHGENIAQIAASRAIIAQIPSLVIAGGFAHENLMLVDAITGMASLFGVQTQLAPHPGFVGALGAAILASRRSAF